LLSLFADKPHRFSRVFLGDVLGIASWTDSVGVFWEQRAAL
jgi:hypothetical protein